VRKSEENLVVYGLKDFMCPVMRDIETYVDIDWSGYFCVNVF
jgi:hypothetical protein